MSLRQAMPQTAAWIDELRDAFGADAINASIRKGMAGLPGHFHAEENGRQAGTEFISFGIEVSAAQMVIQKTEEEPHENPRTRR